MLAWLPLQRRRLFAKAALARTLWLLGALVLLVAAVMIEFRPLSSMMRNQRELRA